MLCRLRYYLSVAILTTPVTFTLPVHSFTLRLGHSLLTEINTVVVYRVCIPVDTILITTHYISKNKTRATTQFDLLSVIVPGAIS